MAQIGQSVDFGKAIDLGHVEGRTVLITGGASGIGHGIAQTMAERGAFVAIVDKNEKLGRPREAQLLDAGFHARFVQADVTSWTSLQSAFQDCLQHSPSHSLDIVIACAGIPSASVLTETFVDGLTSSDDLPEPSGLATINVNLIGTYYTMVLALHFFAKGQAFNDVNGREKGISNVNDRSHAKRLATPGSVFHKHLIFIGSTFSYVGLPFVSAYYASKMGVRGLWKSLRMPVLFDGDKKALPYPFRTNFVAPTWVRTAMIEGFVDELEMAGCKVCAVSDVVDVIMRIVCDESVSGRAICVAQDGKSFDVEDDANGAEGGKKIWEMLGRTDVFGDMKGLGGMERWFGSG